MTKRTWALGLFLLTMVLGLTPGPILPLMASCARADAFNAKPGTWEMTITTLTTGMPAPPDMLAQMSPEQRAKIEAMMQARAGRQAGSGLAIVLPFFLLHHTWLITDSTFGLPC